MHCARERKMIRDLRYQRPQRDERGMYPGVENRINGSDPAFGSTSAAGAIPNDQEHTKNRPAAGTPGCTLIGTQKGNPDDVRLENTDMMLNR
jgi:hypothetical protein